MNKRVWNLLFFAVATTTIVLAGCGDDETDSCPPVPVLSIRNGTWEEMAIITERHSSVENCVYTDSTIVTPDTAVTFTSTDTILYCDLLPAGSSSSICCDTEINGNQVSFDCVLSFPFANPCEVRLEITGSGTVTDTTYDLLVQCLELPIAGPSPPCDIYALDGWGDTCTVSFQRTGRWLSSEGDSVCTGNNAEQGGTLVEQMMERLISGLR